jgi:hypothetical protein
VVCSDPTTSAGPAERAGAGDEELGYTRKFAIGTRVTKRLADAVAKLAADVGDLTAPDVGYHRTVPPLAQLKAEAATAGASQGAA